MNQTCMVATEDQMNGKGVLLRSWVMILEEGDSKRNWGQAIEAAEEYSKIVSQMRANVSESSCAFKDHEKSCLQKLRRELHQLTEGLKNFTIQPNQIEDKMKDIKQTLLSMQTEKEICGVSIAPHKSCLVIGVDKIGIKNPQELFQPYITISLRNNKGELMEEIHETCYSSKFQGNHIIFNSEPIKIMTPVSELPPGAAVFFELSHYKPSKRKISIKCFAFMEQDEFKKGQIALELYKKPTDVTRKRLILFSFRKLYLHLTLSYT